MAGIAELAERLPGLAARRDGKMAVALATQACALSDWADSSCLATLAAAHAELGSLAEAIRFAEQALEFAPPNHQVRCRQELADYRKKRTALG